MGIRTYTKAERRAQAVSVLLHNDTTDSAEAAALSGFLTLWGLTALDPVTFGTDMSSKLGASDVSITSGAAALTSPSNPWAATDVGKEIFVQGAGAAGATLRATIATYVSAGSITLSVLAQTTVAASASSASGIALWGNPAETEATFNVADFGATGNGTSDDTDAIQAAIIAAVAAGGGVVLMPAGTFRTRKTITMGTKVRLVGAGDATVIKPLDSSADAANPAILLRNIDYAQVTDLKIDGNATGLTQAVGHSGIYMAGTRYCAVRRVHVTDLGKSASAYAGAHILLTAYEASDSSLLSIDVAGVHSVGNVVEDCVLDDTNAKCEFGVRLFTNFDYDIVEGSFAVFCRENAVRGNRLIGFAWNAIEICGPATWFNTIEDNRVSAHRGYTAVEADKGASYNVFAANEARDFLAKKLNAAESALEGAAMRCQGGVASSGKLRYARGNRFSGCVVKNLGAQATTSAGFLFSKAYDNELCDSIFDVAIDAGISNGVVIGDRVSGARVRRNVVKGMASTGRGIGNEPYQSNLAENMANIEVADNDVIAAYGGIYFGNSDAGAFTFKDVTVRGNYVRGGCSNHAIGMAAGTTDGLIADNIVVDNTGEAIRANGTRPRIIGNTLRRQSGSANAIYVQSSATGATVERNAVIAFTSSALVFRFDPAAELPLMAGNQFDTTVLSDAQGRKEYIDSAMPTVGSWRRGDIVWKWNAAEAGSASSKYVLLGWIRLVTGSAHVLNTDWVELRTLTGN